MRQLVDVYRGEIRKANPIPFSAGAVREFRRGVVTGLTNLATEMVGQLEKMAAEEVVATDDDCYSPVEQVTLARKSLDEMPVAQLLAQIDQVGVPLSIRIRFRKKTMGDLFEVFGPIGITAGLWVRGRENVLS